MTAQWVEAGWQPESSRSGFRTFTRPGDLAMLMIDRPDRRNALTSQMWAALPELLDPLAGARALVVTGAGAAFSAGADIGELQTVYGSPDAAARYHAVNVAAEEALAGFGAPTIAAVSGACVGGGCQLAVACDLRVAASGARFGVTPAKLGVVYPAVPTVRLATVIGPARAKYLLFTAALIDATTALTYGLVDEVVPSGELAARATTLATRIASGSQQTIGAASAVIDAWSAGEPVDEAIAGFVDAARRQPDVTEGVAAFLEGRAPHFQAPPSAGSDRLS